MAVVAGLLGFLRLPKAFFMYDDFAWLALSSQWSEGSLPLWYNPWRVFTPLTHLAYLINYNLWGAHAAGYYLFNLVLHSLVVVLVYLLGRSLGMERPAAGIGAALFAVLFAHWEAVVWITGVIRLFLALFILLSLIFLIVYLRTSRRRYYLLSLVMFAFALLAKEWALELLPVALLAIFLWSRALAAKGLRWQRKVMLCIPYLALSAVFLAFLTWYWRLDAQQFPFESTRFFNIGANIPRNFVTGLSALLVPSPVWDPVRNRLSQLAPSAIPLLWNLGIVAALCSALLMIEAVIWGKLPVKGLVAWFAFSLAFVSTSNIGLPSRYLYIPAVPFCLLLGSGAGWLLHRVATMRHGSWLKRSLVAVGVLYLVLNMTGNWLTARFMVTNGNVRRQLVLDLQAAVTEAGGSEITVVGVPGNYSDVVWLGDHFNTDGSYTRWPVRLATQMADVAQSAPKILLFDGSKLIAVER